MEKKHLISLFFVVVWIIIFTLKIEFLKNESFLIYFTRKNNV